MPKILKESRQHKYYIGVDKLWEEDTSDWKQSLRQKGVPVKDVRKTVYEGRGRLVVELHEPYDAKDMRVIVEDEADYPKEEHYYRTTDEIELSPTTNSWQFEPVTIEEGIYLRVEGEVVEGTWELIVVEGDHENFHSRVTVNEWNRISDSLEHVGEFMIQKSDSDNSESDDDNDGDEDDDNEYDDYGNKGPQDRDYSRVSDDWPDLGVREPLSVWMAGSPVTDQFFFDDEEEDKEDSEDEPEEEGDES